MATQEDTPRMDGLPDWWCSPENMTIVKSTAPIMQEHGYAIVTEMYRTMFEAHPTVSHMFNATHQIEIDGERARQRASLAGAVAAYAQHIDNPAALDAAIAIIVDKHVTLDVQPAQYAVVKQHLLNAVVTVLGDAVTPDVAGAWTEAYDVLAKVLIDAEEAKYREMEQSKGWRGFRSFQVVDKVTENDTIVSVVLKPAGVQELRQSDTSAPLKPSRATSAKAAASSASICPFLAKQQQQAPKLEPAMRVPGYTAGQFVGVRAQIGGRPVVRNYTVSCAPNGETLRLTVRRECERDGKPAGVMSSFLHDDVQRGDFLELTSPAGGFTLTSAALTPGKPLYFFTAGVGCTPTIAMLEHLVATQHQGPVHVVSVNRTPDSEAMHAYLAHVGKDHANIDVAFEYTNTGGNASQAAAMAQINRRIAAGGAEAEFFVCGPPAFTKTVQDMLDTAGVKKTQQHSELFGPMM